MIAVRGQSRDIEMTSARFGESASRRPHVGVVMRMTKANTNRKRTEQSQGEQGEGEQMQHLQRQSAARLAAGGNGAIGAHCGCQLFG